MSSLPSTICDTRGSSCCNTKSDRVVNPNFLVLQCPKDLLAAVSMFFFPLSVSFITDIVIQEKRSLSRMLENNYCI